jgi:hypothetical protein
MNTQYFKRFTHNAQADLERGYSFVGYQLSATREKAFENCAIDTGEYFEDGFNLETYMEENEDMVAQDNVTGLWGVSRAGLCGFGPFESLEEALADDTKEYGIIDEMHIFIGVQCVWDTSADEGVTFQPISIVS